MPLRFKLTGLALLLCCLSSLGCNTYRQPPYPAVWEIEAVALGKAHAAYRAADGSIAVRYHIEREHQPSYTGYHWLVIEPEVAELVLRPKADFQSPEHTRHMRDFVTVRSVDGEREPNLFERINAWIEPPILESGLPDDKPPAGVAQPIRPLVMVFDEEGRLSLRDPVTPKTETRVIDLWPRVQYDQTAKGAAYERRYRAVTKPINEFGWLITQPFRYCLTQYLQWRFQK